MLPRLSIGRERSSGAGFGARDPFGGGLMRAKVVLAGGSAALPIRDFLARANVEFDYRDGEGTPGVAVCTLPAAFVSCHPA